MELPFAVSDHQPTSSAASLAMMSSNGSASKPSSINHGPSPHPSYNNSSVSQQHHHQQRQTSLQPTMQTNTTHNQSAVDSTSNSSSSGGGGGILYNNLIPGHYRYGACPPAPPPGPLSAYNSSLQQNPSSFASFTNDNQAIHTQLQRNARASSTHGQYNNTINTAASSNSGQQYSHQNSQQMTTPNMQATQPGEFYLHVEEPDDDDDDLLVIDSPDLVDEVEDDDERYYRPFHHAGGSNASSIMSGNIGHNSNHNHNVQNRSIGDSSISIHRINSIANDHNKHIVNHMNTKPVDILAILLSGPANSSSREESQDNTTNKTENCTEDVTILMEDAASKSRKARSMTITLASQRQEKVVYSENDANGDKSNEDDNELYVATANAHTEAAVAYQKVYRQLLGLGEAKRTNTNPGSGGTDKKEKNGNSASTTLSSGAEIAKSMLILANEHARMAASLGTMGVKWNMGKVDSAGRMVSKYSTNGSDAANNKSKIDSSKSSGGREEGGQRVQNTETSPSSSSNTTTNSTGIPQHERLRMAVRGALDTANHEEDITNSTFLDRSTILNATKNAARGNKVIAKNATVNSGMNRASNESNFRGANPVDDLMKLEKELKCMDMALEMGSSVASLGAAVASRPDGSFCVVPPGSSYMSSSSMWTSGILGVSGGGSHQQHHQHHERPNAMPPKGMTAVRSRKNLVQNFLGGSNAPVAAGHTHVPVRTGMLPNTQVTPPVAAPSPTMTQQKEENLTSNTALESSWYGGGAGSMMSSVLASSAITTAATSGQRHPSTPGSNQTAQSSPSRDSANTKQLMQLMDSLNRLGNENAQLMREVEEAKAARAEAKAAREMMAQFKADYDQRFTKVKEALKKYPKQHGNSAPDNPVTNSDYLKSTAVLEMKKRDQIIIALSADLRKEREEAKKKDTALRKYEGFYREVKARSAEKARQRQLQEEQKKLLLKQQQKQLQQR